MELAPPPTMVESPLHQPTSEEEEEIDDFDQGESKAEGRATKEAEQIRFIENVTSIRMKSSLMKIRAK
jgi:hypothetical protein